MKLWNTLSGFCFVTFHEHSGGITGVVFTPNGQAVLSSSLDGTVRAFDLNRYIVGLHDVLMSDVSRLFYWFGTVLRAFELNSFRQMFNLFSTSNVLSMLILL